MVNFRQYKKNYWPKIGVLRKTSKFWSKNEVFVKNRNFGQKLEFSSKIGILVKNRNFGQKINLQYVENEIFSNLQQLG